MSGDFDGQAPRDALAAIAADFHTRGWMAGTAGNLSARVDADSFWITASGRPKGRLDAEDFVHVTVRDGTVIGAPAYQRAPSAETVIHRAIYRLFPSARACLHVHTVDACIAAETVAPDAAMLPLPPIEMIKGLGIWDASPAVSLPLFDNHADVPMIAAEIGQRFATYPPEVTALMVRGHGVTVWGDSLQQAYDRLEVVEFLMQYIARRSGVGYG